MRYIVILLFMAFAQSGACATYASDQRDSDRINELEAELDQLTERAAEIEAELAVLRSRSLGMAEAVHLARADDEEHEFISYPVYRFHDDDLHVTLPRTGYVTYHDAEHRIPRWVSQKLTKEWVEATAHYSGRPSWRTDPELSGIGAVNSDYTHSGYSRGHQAMQATLRGRGQFGEREGMYFGNAAPQMQGFNGGIWLRLENQVINWAKEHDEVWMVCGPVVGESPPTLKGQGRVSIPSSYYKIVVRESEDGIAIIAFLFDHEPEEQYDDLIDGIVSVRLIESVTGLDFFSELPPDVQDDLELTRYSMSFDGSPLFGDDGQSINSVADSQTVYVTSHGRRYHLAGCRYLREGGSPIELREAQDRFQSCAVCHTSN